MLHTPFHTLVVERSLHGRRHNGTRSAAQRRKAALPFPVCIGVRQEVVCEQGVQVQHVCNPRNRAGNTANRCEAAEPAVATPNLIRGV